MPDQTITVASALPLVNDIAALRRLVGAWMLLGRPVHEYVGAEGWMYRTRSVEPNVVQIGEARILLRADDVLLPCRKRTPDASFQSMVLIGRADNNDVVIAHPSVSKLHARLELGAADADAHLSDAESSNGTLVDEVLLAPNARCTVRSGSVLTFGSCAFVLVSTAHLQRALQAKASQL